MGAQPTRAFIYPPAYLQKINVRTDHQLFGAYPKLAVDYLIENELPGRLFNGGNYAGYLIWRLSPERMKVFTDNRFDIYGSRFIQDEQIVLRAFEGDEDLPNWRAVLRRWDVRTVFVPVGSKIHGALADEPPWPEGAWPCSRIP